MRKPARRTILTGAFLLLLLLAVPVFRAPRAPATFIEGRYLAPPSNIAIPSLTFKDGRVHLRRSNFGPLPLPVVERFGRYEITGSTLRLTFDSADVPPFTLHYRSIGGVAALLDDPSAQSFDREQRLAFARPVPVGFPFQKEPPPAIAHAYLRCTDPDAEQDLALWWIGILHRYPDFAATDPSSPGLLQSFPYATYQRLRWRAFCEHHPTLTHYLPK